MKRLNIVLLLSFVIVFVQAEISLPKFFASDMVLQQQTTVKIWGKADPNKRVKVFTSWNLKRYKTTADNNGDWSIAFNTGKAGGPYFITISDGKLLKLNNILLGEVWLCSGQSNMEMPMKGFMGQPIEGGNTAIMQSENDQLRLFRVARKADLEEQTDVVGRWEEALPISVRDFSATAYYFGKILQETLNVPVGLICSSWGGSIIEAWMDEDMLKAFPNAVIPTQSDAIKHPHKTPTMLYKGMLKPLAGIAVKGVIWYQGESNKDNYDEYPELFRTMTDGWRKAWGQKEMPFYFCQIAPYKYGGGKNSAFIREAQAKTAKQPQAAMAVLMDTGEELCIHPAKKREAGERLAYLALQKSYNYQGIVAESPEYKTFEIKDNKVTILFDKAPMGIYAKGRRSQQFQIAGADKVFYPAEAVVHNNKVVVSSEQVPHPVAVRYAFDDFVVGDLFGMGDLPVSSFRTDDWDE